ncbi:hypothetical protein B5D80_28030 [Micromonospora wenchangensis]|uniref:Uncharacterized protein n=1 Tax=Micromonospora wenchangensis TaxID=1185415 RepID=A0A246RFV2_9ACTN|nr:DUF2610 domain-containing protein [Micromonospora wenchangensis]OWV00282.1 hypothetical protein B5D80_28030 [Micromonospora wenchangensis]
MQTLMVPCTFDDDETAMFPFRVGQPCADAHPLEQQLAWLARERGGQAPQEIVDSLTQLQRLAVEQSTKLEDLVAHAMREAAVFSVPGSPS